MKVTVDRRRLRARMIEEDKNSLIRALKQDDAKAAKQALTGMSGEDLGLSHKEFGQLTKNVYGADKFDRGESGDIHPSLEKARQVLKIQGKDTKQSTATHNPVTAQPWSSGPVKDGAAIGDDLVKKEIQRINDVVKQMGGTGFRDIYYVSGNASTSHKPYFLMIAPADISKEHFKDYKNITHSSGHSNVQKNFGSFEVTAEPERGRIFVEPANDELYDFLMKKYHLTDKTKPGI